MVKYTLILLALLFKQDLAHADIITELGGGAQIDSYTSAVLDTRCLSSVLYTSKSPSFVRDDQGRIRTVPCGGGNPLFVGWPIAYQSPDGRWRVGLFHMSHWLQGPPFNREAETSINCLCASWTINWSAIRRERTERHRARVGARIRDPR